jgi:hypothetical protein
MPLQIACTNGTVVVSILTNSTGLLYGGAFETTTNLSPPVVWTISNYLGGSVLFNSPATNSREFFRFWQSYPVFEFAIFYNLNMEIAPGQPMNIAGPVFCNQNIWEGSELLAFSSTVSAAGTNNTSGVDPFNTSYTSGSSANQGSYAAYDGTPLANFTLGAPSDDNQPLIVHAGNSANLTNVEAILNLPPSALSVPNDAGYAVTNQIYLYNECDLIFSNAPYGTNFGTLTPKGTNIVIYFDDKNNVPRLKPLTSDFYILKTPAATGLYTNYVWPDTLLNRMLYTTDCATNVYYAGWSFVTNVSFYDYRESDTVQALQIDIAKFDTWRTNASPNGGSQYNQQCLFDKYHQIDSIYAYSSVPFIGGTQLPAVRLINGQQLPSSYGLTVATPFPLYVYGNYNVQQTNGGVNDIGSNSTAYTYPAAIMADAITVLSANWNDAYNSSTNLSQRVPTNTTINAAMLEGIVPTNPNGTTAATGYYSGGVENFLRLLEDWNGGTTLTYNGSIVVMFPSIYATNYWGNSAYYGIPKRQWAFDQNFANPTGSGLPPLTPMVQNFSIQ